MVRRSIAEPTNDETRLKPSEKCKEVSGNDHDYANFKNEKIFDSANDGDVVHAIMKNDEVWEYSNELCRLCVTIDYPKQPLVEWIGIIEDIIPDIVKLDDGLPQHVCYSCSRKLHTCLFIKHEFLSACDKLRSMRPSNVYSESQLSNDNDQQVYLLAEDNIEKESNSIEDGAESQLGNDNNQQVILLAEDNVEKESNSIEDGAESQLGTDNDQQVILLTEDNVEKESNSIEDGAESQLGTDNDQQVILLTEDNVEKESNSIEDGAESQLVNDNDQQVILRSEDIINKESCCIEDDISISEGHFSPDVVTDQNETGASCAEHSTDDKKFIDEANSCNQTEADISCSGYSSLDINTAEDHSASKLHKPVTSQGSVFHRINPTVPSASTSGDHKSVPVSHEVIINVENKTKISASKKWCASNNVSWQARPFFITRERCMYSYICSECESIFTSKSLLHKHILHEHTLLKCKICKKRYLRKNRFDIHMLTHAQGKIFCIKCDRTFRTEKILTDHMDVHRLPTHVCPTCGKKFKMKSSLNSHMKYHDIELKQMCTTCGKYLKDIKSLKVHMRLHTGEKPFQCQFCGKAFCSTGSLYGHEVIHKEPKYLCSHCGAQFYITGHYKKHLLLHSSDYQNECPVCFLNFRQSNNRDKHYNSICSKICSCIVCNQTFENIDTLLAHRSSSHTKEDIETAAEKYKETRTVHCRICSQGVYGKSALVLHMNKMHKNVKKSIIKQEVLKIEED